MRKILIGSPIRQKPQMLKHFLHSLETLNKDNLDVHYFFIDDNDVIESKRILKKFAKKHKNVELLPGTPIGSYKCDEFTHQWNDVLVWKVADYKNKILNYAKENFFDNVFLVDSDLVLHPQTLQQLLSAKKDIISEIFWTKWTPQSPLLPQVWLSDEYNMFPAAYKKMADEKKAEAMALFLNQLKTPGIYEVGGLGACSLISYRAIAKGVNFEKIHNLSFWGEDRHFCIRAAALGFKLYVDTHYPAFHIYREADLEKLEGRK